MKLLKRLLLVVMLLLVLLLIAAGVGLHYVRQVPAFYRPYVWGDSQRSVVNQRALNKILKGRREVQESYYAEVRARKAGATPADRPATRPVEIALTEEEVNAFILHNSDTFPDIREKYERYLTDPSIFFKDGEVILAGKLQEYGFVVSLHFKPSLDGDGKLRLALTETSAGTLPVPRFALQGTLKKLEGAIQSQMQTWRKDAKMDASGGMNTSAAAAVGGQVLLAMLSEEPAEGVLFVPVDDNRGTSVPLRLTELSLANGSLKLSATPMSREQERELLARIRK